ncbi:MAG: ABC transporter permease [Pleurocapsa minor GSE-CHR-MK-17-07R]|jgi:NitT/TauT family transport system permease protein|nr:ABC transporter permease [Pleurocapsa minor GSE-CHR-MK 17-07R]
MTDSAPSRESQLAAVARADRPPADYSGLRTALISLAIVVVLLLFWEGMKAFSAANNYAVTIGGTEIDLTIFNNSQLPHLGDIAASFMEPAQRNGPPLYQTLLDAVSFTLVSAIQGFLIGAGIGFALAVLFAHFGFLSRGLMPFVVASQTVPILAIAPMIVIWFGRAGNSQMAIPVIAAYLTFFPVTIYTLRGLTSVPATAVELMETYAASKLEILVKLRLPNAIPQIFTALKIAATSSVVGAIIGELPSGFQNGLGIAILNFARYYNQSPERLWATIFVAGLVGILFFAFIALVERLVVRWKPKESS